MHILSSLQNAEQGKGHILEMCTQSFVYYKNEMNYRKSIFHGQVS